MIYARKEENIVKFTLVVLKFLNMKLFIKIITGFFFLSSRHPFFPLTGIISIGKNYQWAKKLKAKF